MKPIKIDMFCCKCGRNTTIWEAFHRKSSCCGVHSVLGEDLDLDVVDYRYPLFNLIAEKESERINWGDFSDKETK